MLPSSDRLYGEYKEKIVQLEMKQKLGLLSRFSEATFIVFDIETTGGNPVKNGITEIYAMRVRGGEVLDSFYSR